MQSVTQIIGIVLMSVTTTVLIMDYSENYVQTRTVESSDTAVIDALPTNLHDKLEYRSTSDKNDLTVPLWTEEKNESSHPMPSDLTIHDSIDFEEQDESESYRKELLGEIL